MKKRSLEFLGLFVLFTLCSCNNNVQESYQSEWLGENKQDIIDNIEDQFQGFSRTMVETGYRYHELYWAGMDQNWEYAEYQREHMYEALKQGFVRRPKQELSARSFMTMVLPRVEESIQSKDLEKFLESFTTLTNTCNTCHQMEEVPFMTVSVPRERHTVVYF